MAKNPVKSRTPRRPYHHGSLRRGLLDEALATIRAEGVDRVTLREIGSRLGVSRTALYRHFADKRALLAAVATEGFRTLRQQLVAAWAEGGRNRAAFAAMGTAYVRFAIGNSSHYRVMFGGSIDPKVCGPELAAEAAGAFQTLVDALSSLRRAGVVRADDTLTMARYVWAVVHGVSMLAINGQLPDSGSVDALNLYTSDRLLTGIEGRPVE
jgi:AcrR family transcriptional regulator